MIEFRTLRERELDAWYAHCDSVFHEEPGYFRKHFEWDPFRDNSLIFVAVDGGKIVSTVRVFDRIVWIAGRAVKMGGIGEVSTKPEYREKGYAGTLLGMAIEAMRERRMPVSILFGDHPMYQRKSWQFYPVIFKRVTRALLPGLPEGARVRPFQPEDLPFIMGIYDLYAGRLDGAVQRSQAYWKQWVLPQWCHPIVLLSEDRPVAYCCLSRDRQQNVLRIEELNATPQGEELLPGFLRAAANESFDEINVYARLIPRIDGHEFVGYRMMIRANDEYIEDWIGERQTPWIRHAGMFAVDMF